MQRQSDIRRAVADMDAAEQGRDRLASEQWDRIEGDAHMREAMVRLESKVDAVLEHVRVD